MEKPKTFYITTPIYYPNAKPHMGHAYTTVIVDVMTRYRRIMGDETYLLTGTDEHTEKVVKAAQVIGKQPAAYADENVEGFKELYKRLNIKYDQFIRTSDQQVHWPGAVALWEKLAEAGDIYKGVYKGLYCAGAEAFVTEKDLVDEKCPDHDEYPIELEEENYFFKLSKYSDDIKKRIESNELLILPQSRKNEILSLLSQGLKDISFSRPSRAVSWGIPVPGDESQVMYVWCDALSNYITALGYGRQNNELFKKFWPADYHVIGKDILRFHTAIWPAMLLSAGLPLPKAILVHGFITSGGKKMSKSLGNVIDPVELVDEYGGDAVRYYLTRHISPFSDGDMTREGFKKVYNGELANGLGNLTSRIHQMYVMFVPDTSGQRFEDDKTIIQSSRFETYNNHMRTFELHEAISEIWMMLQKLDRDIQERQPFKLFQTDKEGAQKEIKRLAEELWEISALLSPFMPNTGKEIKEIMKNPHYQRKIKALFLRKE